MTFLESVSFWFAQKFVEFLVALGVILLCAILAMVIERRSIKERERWERRRQNAKVRNGQDKTTKEIPTEGKERS